MGRQTETHHQLAWDKEHKERPCYCVQFGLVWFGVGSCKYRTMALGELKYSAGRSIAVGA
jgi:hypothetical protein